MPAEFVQSAVRASAFGHESPLGRYLPRFASARFVAPLDTINRTIRVFHPSMDDNRLSAEAARGRVEAQAALAAAGGSVKLDKGIAQIERAIKLQELTEGSAKAAMDGLERTIDATVWGVGSQCRG